MKLYYDHASGFGYKNTTLDYHKISPGDLPWAKRSFWASKRSITMDSLQFLVHFPDLAVINKILDQPDDEIHKDPQ